MTTKVTDYIAHFLKAQGLQFVFEVTGGMVTHLIDSLNEQTDIKLISTHHEQAAAIAADTVAMITGVPGVALATSGPGATNLLTGIACCYCESVPAVFITGQVNRNEIKRDKPIRQLGFQEVDIVSMAQAVTKAAWLVDDPEEIPRLLTQAFEVAISGRPGPVLLDIPMDVQRAMIDAPTPQKVSKVYDPSITHTPEQMQDIIEGLKHAKRPVILGGGGILCAQADNDFRTLVDKLHVPVVNSLMGLDLLHYDHPLRVGMLGTYGNRWANKVMDQADFVLVLGSRLDVRQTGSETEAFKGNRTFYHVDCEMAEMNHRVTGCHAVHAYLDQFLADALQAVEGESFPEYTEWKAAIAELKAMWPDTHELQGITGINPNAFLHELSHNEETVAAYISDCGQHQMWAAQSIERGKTQRYITSGGMAPMGFALPSAIGAALVSPGRPVVAIAGDGAIQMNIQELQTVVRNQLPIKIIVLNNECQGMVRQFQQSYFDERYHSTIWGYSTPDFCRIAEAYGIPACTITQPEEMAEGIQKLLDDPTQPFLLDVRIDRFTNVYPKVMFGQPISEMEPMIEPAIQPASSLDKQPVTTV